MACGKCKKNRARFKKEVAERRRRIIEKREKEDLDKELETLTPNQQKARLRAESVRKTKERI